MCEVEERLEEAYREDAAESEQLNREWEPADAQYIASTGPDESN